MKRDSSEREREGGGQEESEKAQSNNLWDSLESLLSSLTHPSLLIDTTDREQHQYHLRLPC